MEEKFAAAGAGADQATLATLMQEVTQWNQKWGPIVGGSGATPGTPTSRVASTPNRVICRPEFAETDRPIDTTAAHDWDPAGLLPSGNAFELHV